MLRILITVLITTGALFTSLVIGPANAAEKKTSSEELVGMQVGVDAVISEPLRQTVPIIGRFVTRRSGQVASRVAAIVNSIPVEVGDRVEAGQVITVLNKNVFKWQQELQRAEVRRTAARIKTMKATTELLKIKFKRLNSLKKSPAFSQAKLDDIQQEIVRAESQVAEAETDYSSAKAKLQLAKIDFESAEIKAPYAGVITSKLTSVGAYIKVGSPVVTLIDNATLEIEADVPSNRIAGLKVNIGIDAITDDGLELMTIVRAVVPSENPKTRTRTVRFSPLDHSSLVNIAANQSLTLHLPAGEARQVISVHKDAILNRKGKNLAFVIEGKSVV